MVFAVILVFVLVSVVVVAVAGPSAHALATGPSVAPGSRELVLRFIERSRRYRRGGAWVGLLLAMLVAVIAEAEGRPLIGDGGVSFGALFAIGLGGSIAGSVAAEAFRFRPRRGARTASLEVRDLSRYDDDASSGRELLLAGFALVAAIGGALVGDPAVALWLVPMVLLGALRRWATRRIALRPRPAVSPELGAADDQVRELAASAGLGRPLTTLVLLLLCFQLGDLAAAAADVTNREADAGAWVSGLALFGGVGSFVALLVAIAWWAANRAFGLVPARAARPDRRSVAHAALVVAMVLLPVLVIVVARG